MNAYILAGGFSRRMGSDKTLLPFKGLPLILYLYRKVSQYFPTFVVTKREKLETYRNLGIENLISDRFEGIQTPLVGIYTALHHSDKTLNLILSADLPLLCDQILEFFKTYTYEENYLGFVPKMAGKLHFNCAVYSKNLNPLLEEAIKSNNLSVKQFLPKFKILPEELLEKSNVPANCCFNLNTPHDWELLMTTLKG